MRLSRRDLFRLGFASGAVLLTGGLRTSRADNLPSSPSTTPFLYELLPGRGLPPIAQPVSPFQTLADQSNTVNPDGSMPFHVSGPRVVPDNTEFYKIHIKAVEHSFHPQLPDNLLWGYDGSIPGPTIVSRTGTPQLVRFFNDLPAVDPVGIGEPIDAIHRHGGFQAPEDDGYPLDTFSRGQSRDYFFPNTLEDDLTQNEHATLWYHDHSIDITAQNVYRGLAGFYPNFNQLDTGNESDPPPALGLPSGQYDIGLVLQDRQFDANGFLVYDSFDHNGFLGDKFLVNGLIQPYLNVARRKYRFRFLNGSSARFYNLVLSNGRPFVAIATDSHLLEHPVTVSNFTIGPAERVDVIVDFSGASIHDEIFLVNRQGQTDGRKPDKLVSPGTPLLKFIVNRDAADPSRVPTTLLPVTVGPQQLLPLVKVQRRFKFERSHGAWVINGEFFDENRINAKPKSGEPEIWILEAGGGWAHPVHIHLTEFSILSRNGMKPPPLEQGRKDTVVIGGSFGSVAILIRFAGFTGRYVFHCHNIEHEDMRMMGQFEIVP